VLLPGNRRIVPAPPATIAASPGGVWPPTVWYLAGYVWIVVFVALVLGHYRAARVIAVPRAWSSRAGTGVWSLTLVLLAAVAGTYRIISLGDYAQDPHLIFYRQGPHLIAVGLAELLILAVAAALAAPFTDSPRSPTGLPRPRPAGHGHLRGGRHVLPARR
jgi:hypothetical protein